MLAWKSPIKLWHTRKKFTIKCLQILPKGAKKGQKGGPGGLRRGGVDPPGGWIWGALGGHLRGGDPPPGGGQKGQKVAHQGGPLGLPPRPLQIPYEKWAGWPDSDPPQGGSRGPTPPSGGGFLAPPGLVRGGSPPGGAPGGQKGPKKAHFRPFWGVFPQLGVYGKKKAKKRHFIGVLAEFRPKI